MIEYWLGYDFDRQDELTCQDKLTSEVVVESVISSDQKIAGPGNYNPLLCAAVVFKQHLRSNMAQEGMKSLEETACSTPEGPVLCANNCGFFGTEANLNLCSECYKIHISTQAERVATSTPQASASTPIVVDKDSQIESRPGRTLRAPSNPASVSVGTTGANPKTDGTAADGGSSSTVGSATSVPDQTGESNSGQGTPMRCLSCRKRVGLTGFKCKCGNIYCATHRYFDKHSCTFDYKAAGREAIAQANPVVKADKLDKRC
ncbi:hypothetical protein R1sor_003459 [Riccia sorocarpa]|uniref:Zinc finger A20 and AN1 domain-containing stress-associated protein 8 n=1 Tax=Riccia sorocarpa TaxID=122646 RepID=A0ABD3H4D8_9MARC